MRRWVVTSALACTVAFAGACAGDTIAPRASRDLGATYDGLLAAVDAGDRAEARRALRALTDAVDSWEEAGAIDPARADEITAAAARVLADLTLLPKSEPVVPSPTIAPSPSPSPVESDDEDEDHGEDVPPGHEKNEDKGEKNGHEQD